MYIYIYICIRVCINIMYIQCISYTKERTYSSSFRLLCCRRQAHAPRLRVLRDVSICLCSRLHIRVDDVLMYECM